MLTYVIAARPKIIHH